jgi:hypothetical protein
MNPCLSLPYSILSLPQTQKHQQCDAGCPQDLRYYVEMKTILDCMEQRNSPASLLMEAMICLRRSESTDWALAAVPGFRGLIWRNSHDDIHLDSSSHRRLA